MPPQDAHDPRGLSVLRARLGPDAPVGDIAAAVLGLWGEVDRALQPIVGQRGVAALYHRSLKLTARAHPWLSGATASPLASVDLDALRGALLQQPPEQARAGGEAFFETFRELLASLVGSPLTERLLRSVWTPPPGAAPEQDTLS